MCCFGSTRSRTNTSSTRRRRRWPKPSRTCSSSKPRSIRRRPPPKGPMRSRELAQQNYDRQAELFEKKIIAQATLDTFTRNLETARQSLVGARAEEERARLAYTSNIDGVNTTVARLTAELADAQWDLDQTVTRAPAAGFVTQVGLRPGMYVVPAPLRPVMVFVNTDKRDQEFTAAFQQNSLQRVKAGDEAEAAFDAVPGRVFKGKVRLVLDAIAAGQLQATADARGCRRPHGGRPGAGRHRHRRTTCRPTRSRSAPPPRSRSIPSTGTMSRCCARFCCACAAGRTTSSSRGIENVGGPSMLSSAASG